MVILVPKMGVKGGVITYAGWVLAFSPSPANVGQPVTITVDNSPTPTGDPIEFFSGSTYLGQSTAGLVGATTFTTSALPAGIDAITAVFAGDATYPPSSSHPTPITVFDPLPPPILSGLSSTTGSTAGGKQVILSGTGFTGTTTVLFGKIPASKFVVNSDTQITAFAPPQPAGTVDVTVATSAGISPASSSYQFTYSSASSPSVSGLSVSSGSTGGGTLVTISGSNFTGASAVKFGSVQVGSFTLLNDGSIVVAATPEPSGTIDVTVATPSGTSSTGSADHFTYTSATAPAVSGLDVTSGSTTGDTLVTILGSNFTGATSVSFGSVSATGFVVNSDSSISVYAPAQAAGTVDITVSTYAGTSSTSSADHFTYTIPGVPSVSSLSPSSGSTAGGTLVTLSGSGFTDASAVTLNGNTISDFTVNSDNQITLIMPPGSAGVWDLTVTSPIGASTPSSSDQFTYSLASAPTVSSLGTSSGSTAGGTPVTITGTNFTGTSLVYFGSMPTQFTVNSATSITAIAPSQVAGTVDVKVQTTAGIPTVGGVFC